MKVERANLIEAMKELKGKGFSYLVKITAVDYQDHMQILYFLRDIEKRKDETVEVDLPNDSLSVPTVVPLYKAADWYERELHEMFGILIEGRNTRRLLLEKWDGTDAPLRKSFVWGSKYRV
ncbi:MAG: NADH-quinone oxidoreductase subunit C [Candidatus Micrarchaeaceae archaeon]